MGERKPADHTFESWVEKQVREAAERGEFDNLPGAGKPLRDLDTPLTGEEWAARMARREGLDLSAMLPPHLAFRRERAALRESMPSLRGEAEVREVAADFNARLLAEYRRPQLGTPLAVALLDVEEAVAAWRAAHPEPPAPPAPTRQDPPPRRSWWRRLRRG
ncbi:DUF1992 domain-containing protein [Kineococcus sp. NUM-3379]